MLASALSAVREVLDLINNLRSYAEGAESTTAIRGGADDDDGGNDDSQKWLDSLAEEAGEAD
jgi:hypothetical protein